MIVARPVIPLLAAFILGVTLGAGAPGLGRWGYGTVAACFLCSGFHIIRGREHLVSVLLLFTGLGYLSIQVWVDPQFPPHHITHYTGTDKYNIAGQVIQPPVKRGNRLRLVVETESLERNAWKFPTSGRLRVTVIGEAPEIRTGDRVRFHSRIRKIRNFNNPGGFNYARYMAFRGIWSSAYTPADGLEIDAGNKTVRNRLDINAIRTSLAALIDRATKNPENQILKALIIGDRSGISRQLRDQFNRTGVGHLLAISGLHIGIVATVSFLSFQALFSRLRYLLRRAWVRKGAAFFSVFPVLAYGLIAGMTPSTQRAVIMATAFLLTFMLDRDHDLINILAVAAMVILVIHPPSLFSISFQLSFAAVLSIIYGLSRIRQKTFFKDAFGAGIRGRLTSFLAVSILAILGTWPLTMFYFNQVSYVGLPGNFIAVPMIGFGVVPLGLLSALLSPFTPEGAMLLFKLAGVILTLALKVLSIMAAWPFAASKTVTPNLVEIGCWYMLAWGLLNLDVYGCKTTLQSPPRPPDLDRFGWLSGQRLPDQNRYLTRRTAVSAALALVISAAGIDAGYWVYERFLNPRLRVTYLDVGHGNAALLEAPKGGVVLIDGGGFSDNSAFDVGAGIVAPLLWRKKIKTVHTVILSHPNSDHYNGLRFIVRHFRVNRIWINGQTSEAESYQDFLKAVRDKEIDLISQHALSQGMQLGNLRADILYPPRDLVTKTSREAWRDTNNNSLVIRIGLGSVSFLFPGDIETRAEEELVAFSGTRLKSAVLLAPHHGSQTSSSSLFLAKVEPQIVVFSHGRQNRFNFPHPRIIRRYTSRKIKILSTADNGAVTVVTDGRSISVKTFKDGEKK